MERPTATKEPQSLQKLTEALRTKKGRIQDGVLSWAGNSIARYPWRRAGSTPYEVLIGEILIGRTTYAVASRVYRVFLRRFPSLSALAEANEDELAKALDFSYMKRYGAFMKTVIQDLLKVKIIKVPSDSYALRALGLQPYNINAIMCFGYGFHLAIIDSNVSRMLSRLFCKSLPAQPPQGLIHAIGEALLPDRNAAQYNANLLDLADQICSFARPLCPQCLVLDVCDHASTCVGTPSIPIKF
jgi:A/G-specific adenine glycosylase